MIFVCKVTYYFACDKIFCMKMYFISNFIEDKVRFNAYIANAAFS